jgi:hypothetical protein
VNAHDKSSASGRAALILFRIRLRFQTRLIRRFSSTATMQAQFGRATEATTKALTCALMGAFVFWTPNVLVHWIIA